MKIDRQRRVEVIAYLYSRSTSVPESKIAEELGSSTTTVFEDLQIARKSGLLIEERRFEASKMFETKRIEMLSLFDYAFRLKIHLQKYSKTLQNLFILDSGTDGAVTSGF